jgi:hypothetical protein
MDVLQAQIDYWNTYSVPVCWFVNADRTEAIAIGDGFAWSATADGATSEATLGEWSTGIEL